MKSYKFYILIAALLLGVCAHSSVFAIRVDFLNKPNTIQPPPNVSGGINSYFGQNKNKNEQNNLPNEINTQNNNNCVGVNCEHGKNNSNFLIAFIIAIVFIVVVVGLIIFWVKKRKSGII